MINYKLLIKKVSQNRGYILISTLVFATIAIIILNSLASWSVMNYRLAIQIVDKEKAFQIAEAGIDYYRWHLAHSPLDFQDGTATSGPYVHPYYDNLGNLIGQYELTITPPLIGSTATKIISKGTVASSTVSRSIEVIFAIPSLSKYSVVANAVLRFGEGTVIFGPVHSNNGIRMDGLAHNIVTSALFSYDDLSHNGVEEFAVHTHVQASSNGLSEGGLKEEESSNLVIPIRTDIFVAGRLLSIPAVDFTGFTQKLSDLKTLAQADGLYFGSSGSLGYNIVLKTDGTFDLYKVTKLVEAKKSCYKPNQDGQEGWGTWSIENQSLVGNYIYPTNGVIFAEDNVWVEGKIDNTRLTIASGKFPESSNTNTNISFTKDILYTNYDGRDSLALIAQNNINAGMTSEDDLEINAALVAKNGRAGRYYYNSSCSPYDNRARFHLYGTLVSNLQYGFAYIGTQGKGYDIREIVYDTNMLYSPPPFFPLLGSQYVAISWREI